MVKRYSIFVMLLLAAACGKKEDDNGHAGGVFKMVSDRQGTASVFSNAGSGVQEVTFAGEAVEAKFPPTSTRLIAVMPALGITEGRANSVRMEIPATQKQAVSGTDGMQGNYFYCKAPAADNPVSFTFAPMCQTLSVTVSGAPEEKLKGIVLSQSTPGIVGFSTMDLFKNSVIGKIDGGASNMSVTLDQAASLAQPVTVFFHTACATLSGIQMKLVTETQYLQVLLSKELGSSTPSEMSVAIDIDAGTVTVDGVKDEKAVVLKGENGDFASLLLLDEVADVDRIPDFSRVGYKYGDAAIPSPAVKETIDINAIGQALSNKTASDTTDYFQQVIDRVGKAGGGAILVKNGTYNVSRILFLDGNDVVLRGESESGTVIKFNSKRGAPVIYIGRTVLRKSGESEPSDGSYTFMAGRRVNVSRMKAMGNEGSSSYGTVYIVTYSPACSNMTIGSNSPIVEDYVPLGRLWVEVRNPNLFQVGDNVRIHRRPTTQWLDDIGMTQIAKNGRESQGAGTNQWDVSTYTMDWTRKVAGIQGNRIYLDAPVAQSLETRYGGGDLQHYAWDRVSGCGVENLTIDCKYDKSVLYNGKETDEAHAWIAVQFKAAEHCWVRNVTSRHMGYGLADMNYGARCITVEKCSSLTPVSAVQGARRYAFCCTGGSELVLVKDCYCEDDRHSYVTNGTALGPNVFTNCKSVSGNNVVGPHWGWASATLYDCIEADTNFEAQDGGCQGTGHGWRGMTTVFWNVSTTKQIVAQSAWGTCPECGSQWNRTEVCSNCGASIVPSGRNYAVGCTGTKVSHTVYWDKDYYGNPTTDFFVSKYGYGTAGENRPDGQWYPERTYGESGGSPIMLPYEAPVPWWPLLTTAQFSNPKSLYQCQLEDRHARGIYLNTL